ncbi:MAG: sulfatase-like hydrolase/transferase [Planctomycetaceae bacterium]|nr:sulfatase-like hydrolase/transferase [Planctomycetales bacterium]MCB9920594.1 sulfatase-like hydrolase/transferase [Planctomycetaceae bacterium]
MMICNRFVICYLFSVAACCLTLHARQPNVILIYTDDQGTIDANCYGAKDLITPNIDALAERGIRFTQFYSAAPVCSPSRAAVLTGRYPQRAGLPSNAGSGKGAEGMPASQVTIAEMLKTAGYATGHIGKWHLGYIPETMPNGQGFDYSFGHMGGCIDNYSHYFYWQGPNRHDLWENGVEIWKDGKFFPDLMVEEATKFIESNQERPFFLYWPINTPHYPLQGTNEWRERYADLPEPRRQYAAFVSTTDEKIGQLLDCVQRLGLTDDTVVIFQSDHGHSTEERTFGGGGNAGPYRGAKFSLFEGGIRVPAIISFPGTVPQNEQRDQLAVSVDWMPTIAKLCSVPLPERRIDGRSLVDVLTTSGATSTHGVFHWQSGRGLGGKPQWAVRDGDWKLIGNPNDTSNQAPLTADDARFLVNLADDPSETTNLAKSRPELVQRLTELHETWLDDVELQ